MESLLTTEYHDQIEDMALSMLSGAESQDVMIKRMCKSIVSLAACGKVILIGRGASCLTRGFKKGIHLRLIAPLDVRIRRMMSMMHVSQKEAEKLTLERDKARERLVRTYFNRRVEDPLLYDVVWNTGEVAISLIAKQVVHWVHDR